MIASLVNGKEEEGGLAVLGTRMGRWNFAVILPGHTLSLSPLEMASCRGSVVSRPAGTVVTCYSS
jgi:hypothetical protein